MKHGASVHRTSSKTNNQTYPTQTPNPQRTPVKRLHLLQGSLGFQSLMLLFLSSTVTLAITLPLTTVGGVNPKTNYRCSASFADACQISSPRPRDKSLQNRLANRMGLEGPET